MAFRVAGPVANVAPVFVGGAYGCFVSTQNQANGGSTTANKVTLNTQIDGLSGMTNTNGTITFTTAGNYQVICELFFTSTTGANPTISQWLVKNGTNVANSCQDFQLLGGANTTQIAICAFHVSVLVGDTLEFYWHSSNTNVSIVAQGTQTSPSRPASPSAIVVLQQVA